MHKKSARLCAQDHDGIVPVAPDGQLLRHARWQRQQVDLRLIFGGVSTALPQRKPGLPAQTTQAAASKASSTSHAPYQLHIAALVFTVGWGHRLAVNIAPSAPAATPTAAAAPTPSAAAPAPPPTAAALQGSPWLHAVRRGVLCGGRSSWAAWLLCTLPLLLCFSCRRCRLLCCCLFLCLPNPLCWAHAPQLAAWDGWAHPPCRPLPFPGRLSGRRRAGNPPVALAAIAPAVAASLGG